MKCVETAFAIWISGVRSALAKQGRYLPTGEGGDWRDYFDEGYAPKDAVGEMPAYARCDGEALRPAQ